MAADKKQNLQKVWEEAKEEAMRLSKDLSRWVKKGEKELVKFSGQAKVGYDIMGLKVKKEQLLYAIGKEYYAAAKAGGRPAAKVGKLVKQIKEIDEKIALDQKLLKKK